MAVYQGARERPLFLPPRGRTVDPPVLSRRRVRGAVRSGRRSSRVGLLVGGIVIAFLLAFFSLAQTVTVSATTYDVDQLLDDRQRLEAQALQVRSDLDRLGREPAIRKQAIDAGFGQLADPVVVTAR
ncbi:MAG TPA: hypothetical protein VH720_03000 [Candidatus Limnocylindrales bacterium]|jgi:hypothetical protein